MEQKALHKVVVNSAKIWGIKIEIYLTAEVPMGINIDQPGVQRNFYQMTPSNVVPQCCDLLFVSFSEARLCDLSLSFSVDDGNEGAAAAAAAVGRWRPQEVSGHRVDGEVKLVSAVIDKQLQGRQHFTHHSLGQLTFRHFAVTHFAPATSAVIAVTCWPCLQFKTLSISYCNSQKRPLRR